MSKELKYSKISYQDTLLIPKSNTDTVIHLNNTTQGITHQTFLNESKRIKANESLSTTLITDSTNRESEFINIYFNDKTLINNYKDYSSFNSSKDRNCYIVYKESVKSNNSKILIESKANIKHVERDYIIKEKPIINGDWTIIPIILGLFLLVSIVVRYRKYLGVLLESTIYRFSSNKILNEKSSQFQRLELFLDILFVISFSLAVDQIVKGLGIYTPPENFKFIVFAAFGSLVIALRLFRLIVFKLSGVFSNHKVFFNDLFNSASLYTRVLGVFLLPMVFLITYSSGLLNTFLIYLSIFTILIMLILRTVSIFKAFILRGFSIFYFILYLCALEIVPLLIIWKEVKSR